ncbi:DNA-binding response regulator [Actinoplanes lobatus]|uniref:DNA-binding response OmpR family regulator n=1 Tax=Actinoplanes lobatus TaxID=113568 RepID=A0A7W7HN08_9ACTN|nr:response regulator transcription factor [Actinoplanes lobatus]MBB4753537.1 DNA-binding response OmpR family regulator [Actinoplanes lobatus]GGN84919.1 DNA-binding response regulator [Actinoplanes lobatus]GIE38072.1 DNA-binding response regulator [Actinoplanes lobatus]
MATEILIAEDNPKQAELAAAYLRREGHRVTLVGDGPAVFEACRQRRPDLVVLDVMMPALDGVTVCRVLRAESDVPILMLTARAAEDDILRGLDAGADDYLTKPYSPRELAARVRALLRRSGALRDRDQPVLRTGDLEVDVGRFEVRVGGRPVVLTAKEFGIIEVLAGAPGRVFTRGEILAKAFGFDRYVLERTVDAHVRNLRRKLGDDPDDPRYVQTVYGRGYRLAAEP